MKGCLGRSPFRSLWKFLLFGTLSFQRSQQKFAAEICFRKTFKLDSNLSCSQMESHFQVQCLHNPIECSERLYDRKKLSNVRLVWRLERNWKTFSMSIGKLSEHVLSRLSAKGIVQSGEIGVKHVLQCLLWFLESLSTRDNSLITMSFWERLVEPRN